MAGPEICILPPEAADFGYLNRTWDGSREIQVSKVCFTLLSQPQRQHNTTATL